MQPELIKALNIGSSKSVNQSMQAAEKVLFVADAGTLNFEIPGGVQACTTELIHYLNLAGSDITFCAVNSTRNIVQRVKYRLGLNVYNLYDFNRIALVLAEKLRAEQIRIVALNQVYLSPLVPILRKLVPFKITIVGLSHGNESGDFLHDLNERNPLHLWRLGKMVRKERMFFTELLDGLIIISEHELGLNQWLGAGNQLVVPRMFSPQTLPWHPTGNRIGFVGTLNHAPNLKGLELLAAEMERQGFNGSLRLVGGPKQVGDKLAAKYSFIEYLGKLDEAALELEASTWSIFLNPVFWYARGSSTKLAQGINWGLPVLTTPAGCRGYSLVDETIVVPTHNPADFARTVIATLKAQPQVAALRKAVERNVAGFDPAVVAAQIASFFSSTAAIVNSAL